MGTFTYLWLRNDGTPVYVGKGTQRRAHQQYGHRVRKPADEFILLQEHPSEESALEAEAFLISYYGRLDLGDGCLANLSCGGAVSPSFSGHKHTDETRRRIGVTQKGVPKSAVHAARISAALRGTVKPTLIGNTHTLGKRWKLSEETRQKQRAAQSSRTWIPNKK
jgi:hypothetical protein